jgi:hypothetical protein
MIRSNNINKYFSLENCYIKINPIKSNDKIKYQCLEVSKHVFSSEGEPLTGRTIRTQEDLIFNPEFFGEQRKCYMSEIFYIRKAEIRRLLYYKEEGKYDACSY